MHGLWSMRVRLVTSVVSIAVGAWCVVYESSPCASVVSIDVGAWFVVYESASCDKCSQYRCWCMVCGL